MGENFNDSIFSFSPLSLEYDLSCSNMVIDWEEILARLDNSVSISEYQYVAETISSALMNNLKNTAIDEEQILLLQHAMPTSLKLFKKSFENIGLLAKTSTNNTTNFNEYLTIAISFLQALDNALAKMVSWEKVEIMKMDNLIRSIAEIIYESYSHCKNSEVIYGDYFTSMKDSLSTLFRNTGTVQSQYYILLNNVVIINVECFNDSISIINEVAEILTRIGEVIMNLDLKTMADHWKGFTRFFQQHGEHFSSHIDLSLAISLLASHILDFLNDTDWQNIDESNCLRLLKIANFVLKIVIKLSEIYLEKLTNECHKKVITLLLELNRFSSPILQSNNQLSGFIDFIESFLIIGADPLLSVYIREEKFIQNFLAICETKLNEKNISPSLFLLVVSIMKKLISQNETKENWLSYKNNSFIKILFEFISYGHTEMNLNIKCSILNRLGGPSNTVGLYEYFLTHVASLALTFNPNQYLVLENFLIESLLQTNIWKAIFAIDLWCILARYGSVELCYHQLKNLIELFKLISNDFNRIERVFLSVMISRLYSLLTVRQKIELIQETDSGFLNIFYAIQLNQIPNQISIEKTEILANQLIDKSKEFPISSTDQFILMCNVLFGLAGAKKELIKSRNFNEIKKVIFNAWKCLDFREINSLDTSKEMSVVFTALSMLTSEIISEFEPEEIAQILQVVNILKNTKEANIKLSSLMLIKCLSSTNSYSDQNDKHSNEISRLILLITNQLLKDKNAIIKQTALEMFDYYVHMASNKASLLSEFGKDEELREDLINFFKKTAVKKNNVLLIDYNDYLIAQSKHIFGHKCRNEEIDQKIQRVVPMDIVSDEPMLKKLKMEEHKENKDCKEVYRILSLLKSNIDTLETLRNTSGFSEDIRSNIKTLLKQMEGLL